jgi:hypothetical protein
MVELWSPLRLQTVRLSRYSQQKNSYSSTTQRLPTSLSWLVIIGYAVARLESAERSLLTIYQSGIEEA